MRSLLLFTALLGGLISPTQAQTVWSRPYQPNQIALEAALPEIPDDDASALSGATFLTVTHSFTEHIELAAELPLARYATSAMSTTALGNPYVGLGLSSTSRPILVELGVRIPAAPTDQALEAGKRADLGRTAAFRNEAFSMSALFNTRFALSRHTTLRLRTGPSYASVRTADGSGRKGHWQIPYSAQVWRNGDPLMTGFSVVGRPNITSAVDSVESRHHAVLSVILDGTRIQPGLLIGTGLDPLFKDGRFVLVGGVTLSISYR